MKAITFDLMVTEKDPVSRRKEVEGLAGLYNLNADIITQNGPEGTVRVILIGSVFGLTAFLFALHEGDEDAILTSLSAARSVVPA